MNFYFGLRIAVPTPKSGLLVPKASMALPIPLLPPVIIATLSFSLIYPSLFQKHPNVLVWLYTALMAYCDFNFIVYHPVLTYFLLLSHSRQQLGRSRGIEYSAIALLGQVLGRVS